MSTHTIALRVCKNPKISETRPDPKFSGFLRFDLRNLKFYEVKSRPTCTRIFGFGFFPGFSGIPCWTPYQQRERCEKFANNLLLLTQRRVCARLQAHSLCFYCCCCYSTPVNPKGIISSLRREAAVFLLWAERQREFFNS